MKNLKTFCDATFTDKMRGFKFQVQRFKSMNWTSEVQRVVLNPSTHNWNDTASAPNLKDKPLFQK